MWIIVYEQQNLHCVTIMLTKVTNSLENSFEVIKDIRNVLSQLVVWGEAM